jgi:hypothetical protein
LSHSGLLSRSELGAKPLRRRYCSGEITVNGYISSSSTDTGMAADGAERRLAALSPRRTGLAESNLGSIR